MPSCGQTNIPQTDNTQIECEEFISSNCVVYPEAILAFGLQAGLPLTTIITELVKRIRQDQLAITQLKANVIDLQSQIDEINTTLLGLQTQIDTNHP